MLELSTNESRYDDDSIEYWFTDHRRMWIIQYSPSRDWVEVRDEGEESILFQFKFDVAPGDANATHYALDAALTACAATHVHAYNKGWNDGNHAVKRNLANLLGYDLSQPATD